MDHFSAISSFRSGRVTRFDLNNRSALDEERRDLHRLSKVATRDIAQIKHERACALHLLPEQSSALALQTITTKLLDLDISNAVSNRIGDIGLWRILIPQRGIERCSTCIIFSWSAPGNIYGLALVPT